MHNWLHREKVLVETSIGIGGWQLARLKEMNEESIKFTEDKVNLWQICVNKIY